MDRTFEITPEMLGNTWPKVIRSSALQIPLFLIWMMCLHYSNSSRGNLWEIIIGGLFLFGANVWSARASGTRVRLTESYIEEIDGPVIPKDTIVEVKESGKGIAGLLVIGARDHNFLPKFEIFVPASVAGYDELRAVLLSWAPVFTYAES